MDTNPSASKKQEISLTEQILIDELQIMHQVKFTDYILRGTDYRDRNTINQYSLIKQLGEGAFGTVKLIHKIETGEDFAFKQYSKRILKGQKEMIKDEQTGHLKAKSAFEDVIREIEIMKQLDHPCIVRLHEVITNDNEDKLFLVIDYCSFGQVLDWDPETLKFKSCYPGQEFFNEIDIQKIMRDCVMGLDYMHQMGICHRDIKPQNIMIDQNSIAKLGDFGSAEMFDKGDDTLCKTNGTYQFLSPECCDPKIKSFSGKKVDIWALGITLYCLIYNELPYQADTEVQILDMIQNQGLKLGDREISDDLKQLLFMMLEKDPSKRVTLDDIKNNEWINKGFKIRLNQQEANLMANISDLELQNNNLSVNALDAAKNIAAKMGNKLQRRPTLLVQKKNDMGSQIINDMANPSLTKIQSEQVQRPANF